MLLAGDIAKSRVEENVFLEGLLHLDRESVMTALKKGLKWAGDREDPDLVLISAGFDGIEGDDGNYGHGHLSPHDMRLMFRQLLSWADCHCHGRVVALLEGGYHVLGGMASDLATSVVYGIEEMIEFGKLVTEVGEDQEEEEEKGSGEEEAKGGKEVEAVEG